MFAAAVVALLAAAAASFPHFSVTTPQGVYVIHLLEPNPQRTKVDNNANDPIYNNLKDQAVGYSTQFKPQYAWYSITTYTIITLMAAQAALPERVKKTTAAKIAVALVAVALQVITMTAPPIIHAIQRKSATNSFSHSLPSGMVQTSIEGGLICTAILPIAALIQTVFFPVRTQSTH